MQKASKAKPGAVGVVDPQKGVSCCGGVLGVCVSGGNVGWYEAFLFGLRAQQFPGLIKLLSEVKHEVVWSKVGLLHN